MVTGPEDRSKVVVRRLPPTLSEVDFKATIDSTFGGQYSWLGYVPGKSSLKSVKYSRAYLKFSDQNAVFNFRAKFDGHTFVNETGAQFSCSIEYAPFQRVPKKVKRRDPKEGTLDKDAEFQEFVASLDQEPSHPSALSTGEGDAVSARNGKRITPLMQYLHDKWTGKLLPAGQPSKARQKKSRLPEDFGEPLAPPPGFEVLPAGLTKGQAGGKQRPKLQPVQEAAIMAAEEIHVEEPSAASNGPAAERPKAGRKPRASKKGTSNSAEEATSSAAAEPSEAPKKILKNPAALPVKTVEEEEVPVHTKDTDVRQRSKRQVKKAPPKQVRVRAGFQVYTPKIRPEASESHFQDLPAAAIQSTGSGGWDDLAGVQNGIQPADHGWSTAATGQADPAARKLHPKQQQQQKKAASAQPRAGSFSELPASQSSQQGLHRHGGWDAPVADALRGDSWDTPVGGTEWVLDSESLPPVTSRTGAATSSWEDPADSPGRVAQATAATQGGGWSPEPAKLGTSSGQEVSGGSWDTIVAQVEPSMHPESPTPAEIVPRRGGRRGSRREWRAVTNEAGG